MFSEGFREEIFFWINYSQRRLCIHDLGEISIDNEDLFQMGLTREDLNLERPEMVIDKFELWPTKTLRRRRNIYQNRANQIRALTAF